MTQFLKDLFSIIALDIEYLYIYLNSIEQQYLNDNLKSIADLNDSLWTDEKGDNLEVLLQFLSCNKSDIAEIWNDSSKKEILVTLYTSSVISGDYNCFRFDLSKFAQTFNPVGKKITLYRVGRVNEDNNSLGNSWAKDFSGLKSYIQSSAIDVDGRPVFTINVNDSEVLCKGNQGESELILKKGFNYEKIELLSLEEKRKIVM
jgi:hypothetical protein